MRPLIYILALLYSVNVLATTAASATAGAQQPASQVLPGAQSPDPQATIRVLEAQLQSMREFQGSVLDTVYWALGGIFLVLSLVFGFSWFSNFKLSDRDRQSLHAEMEARIAQAREQVAAAVATSESALDRRFDEQQEAARRALEFIREATQTAVSQSVESSVSGFRRELARLERDTLRIAVRVEGDNVKRHEYLRRFISGTIEGAAHDIPSALALVSRLVEDGLPITLQDATWLNNVLAQVPKEHSAFASQLRDKLIARAK